MAIDKINSHIEAIKCVEGTIQELNRLKNLYRVLLLEESCEHMIRWTNKKNPGITAIINSFEVEDATVHITTNIVTFLKASMSFEKFFYTYEL